jgi:hypothetical protein
MIVEVLGKEEMNWPGYGVSLQPGQNTLAEVPVGLRRSFERHQEAGELRIVSDGDAPKPTSNAATPPAHAGQGGAAQGGGHRRRR